MLALLALSAAAPNLHVAAYKDDVNVIKDQLRLGVDVNLKSEEGDRALHVAVAKGSLRRHVLVVRPTLQADLLGVRVARAVAVLEERKLLLVEVAGGGLDGVRHGEICEANDETEALV